MPAIPRLSTDRFRPEALFAPRSVVVIGAQTPAGLQVLGNLQAAGFAGPVMAAEAGGIVSLAEAPELAVICDEAAGLDQVYADLAARGCFAAVVTGMQGGLRGLAVAHGVRSLGPGSFGVASPGIGLNATRGHLPIAVGRLALVSQSAALCRAVLDWAEPNGVGFSHIVGIGGNDDIGFALILDWLSRDPGTGAILLDIRRIKDARAFLSAARAAGRSRPVVAIRAGSRLADPGGDSDAAFEAALRRAGVLSVVTLEDLLAAAETLTRSPPPRLDQLAIVTNAIGPAQMAADAALRHGLSLAALTVETRGVLSLAVPNAFAVRGGSEVPQGVGDIVYAGMAAPVKLAEACALLAGAREVGGVLIVHAPTGVGDDAGIAALVAGARGLRVPVLACVMGETTGAGHRRRLADAGVPVFATPEQAIRGFLHLVQHRRNRAAAAELPAREVLEIAPDRGTVAGVIAAAHAAGERVLSAEAAGRVMAAYGIAPPAGLRLRLGFDAMFGPVIGVGQGGEAGAALHDMAFDLPPLNLTLARALVSRTRIVVTPEAVEAAADALVRLSQLAVDFAGIVGLEVDGAAEVRLAAPGDRPVRLALPPYPAELAERIEARGERLLIRPIRPEDAEAHGAFFARLSPEDIRYRFFSTLRELSQEQTARMTQIDYDREMAFIAVREGSGETVGVGRLVREALTDEGEFAVIVQADMKGRGVAGHLMRRLIDWARSQGMGAVVGQILSENQPMLGFIRHLGFTVRRLPAEPDVMEARLDLPQG